jgi:hypothetical protein
MLKSRSLRWYGYILLLFFFVCIGGWGSGSWFPDLLRYHDIKKITSAARWITQETKSISRQATNLDPVVLKLGLTAYLKARARGLDGKQLLTVIDYSKPSSERRLWVIDLKNTKVLFNTWVAHGKNSGGAKASSFSNQFHSLKSSLGVFVTAESYAGGHGYSLRIKGLEQGINDNAYQRAVVFHGAWYAARAIAQTQGSLGRSWGCMAVGQDMIKPLVDAIKDNTIVVAYYPDQYWLKNSIFLSA